MKKHPKQAFGIHEDGQVIKLAHLERDGYQVYLVNLDQVELDKPLYVSPEQLSEFEKAHPEKEEVDLDEFSSEYVTGFKLAPWDRIFSSARLERGVIAVNANEENLVRTTGIPESKAAEKTFARGSLTPQVFKRGQWQTSRFEMGGASHLMLHKGANQLLELLKTYAKKNRKSLHFQLADANDIALSDFYRVNNLADNQRHLLVCLGREYRKALLFENQQLVDIYPLNITQDFPEAELIYSRVSFALDNAQQNEPDKIVICGELASEELVNYFNSRDSGRASLLGFPSLSAQKDNGEAYNPVFMAQFALPIALAHKALFPDEERYTPSNFLTRKDLEAQQTFRVAWHGYLALVLIFAVALLGTIAFLGLRADLNKQTELKRRLDYEEQMLRVQTAEIARMREEMEQFRRNMDSIGSILEGRNPWSEVLETLNRIFQARPVSWLTNLRKNGEQLLISGVTTNRNNVIDIALTLPNSRIQKVSNSEIRDTKVWMFEISSDFPDVDWVGMIEADTAEFLARQRKEQEAVEAERLAEEEASRLAAEEKAAAEKTKEEEARIAAEEKKAAEKARADELAAQKRAAEEKATAEKKAKEEEARIAAEKKAGDKKAAEQAVAPKAESAASRKLPSIAKQHMPQVTDWHLKAHREEIDAYNAFVRAVNEGKAEKFKDLGYKFLENHATSRLAPLLRWHFANKLYVYGDYVKAKYVLDPLVRQVDYHYPYALLLAARLDYATKYSRYEKLYQLMRNEYAEHTIGGQVAKDLEIIGGGAQ
jgi:Tfp pilus assembly protein PilN